jgi:16S rRNA (guanine527-N7)-methyltransferase
LDIILKYFPNITQRQQQQFAQLLPLYSEWNEKINVISRKDVENFYERHVLHSLAIAKIIQFTSGTKILDIGTGGGFPGIPLAIMFPDTHFHLVDSIGKKITVVKEVAAALKLTNVKASHARVETLKGDYDFVTARAVAQTEELVKWTKRLIVEDDINNLPNGWLLLKGGDLSEELNQFAANTRIYNIKNYYSEDFFEEKHVVHIKKFLIDA